MKRVRQSIARTFKVPVDGLAAHLRTDVSLRDGFSADVLVVGSRMSAGEEPIARAKLENANNETN